MATHNPCAKRVKPENAYEVWQSFDGQWTYYVLKKYRSPEKEANDPYARWYCFTTSPIVPRGEYGDAYISTVTQGTQKIDNPIAASKPDKRTIGGTSHG